MIRPMKWHIYNPENLPLCWDDAAIDFDSESEAQAFADAHPEIGEYVIKEDILYYDGGYISGAEVILRDIEESEE